MHLYVQFVYLTSTYNNKWQRSAHHNMLSILILLSNITISYLTLIFI